MIKTYHKVAQRLFNYLQHILLNIEGSFEVRNLTLCDS